MRAILPLIALLIKIELFAEDTVYWEVLSAVVFADTVVAFESIT